MASQDVDFVVGEVVLVEVSDLVHQCQPAIGDGLEGVPTYILKQLQALLIVEQQSGEHLRTLGRIDHALNLLLQVQIGMLAANVDDLGLGHGAIASSLAGAGKAVVIDGRHDSDSVSIRARRKTSGEQLGKSQAEAAFRYSFI